MGVVAAVLAIGFTRASSGHSIAAPSAPAPAASASAAPQGPHSSALASPVEVNLHRLDHSQGATQGPKPRKHPQGDDSFGREKPEPSHNSPFTGDQSPGPGGPSTLAISAGTGFDGINNAESACGCLPPDGAVAAGPNHLVAAVNTAFKVWNKSGTLLAGPTSLSTLFSSNSGCLATVSDPFAEYDSAAGRFVLGALTYVSSGTSAICVAVSRTGDPTGNWFVYAFTVTPANDLLDFPHIAIGSDAIFLSGNQYPHNNTFTAARVYAYNKAQMYAGQA